ncbi:DUF2180 family protein [Streptomyces sp. H34-S4]|uniref:DUF2180 family protein n=1 Tax=Streptomyces sp. H34-S4 TaxID=2996463 RepID=UPI003B63D4CF
MLCLDCHTQDVTSPAVGVCRACGAAVCASHARVTRREVRRRPLLAPPSDVSPRTVHCSLCAAVHAG